MPYDALAALALLMFLLVAFRFTPAGREFEVAVAIGFVVAGLVACAVGVLVASWGMTPADGYFGPNGPMQQVIAVGIGAMAAAMGGRTVAAGIAGFVSQTRGHRPAGWELGGALIGAVLAVAASPLIASGVLAG